MQTVDRLITYFTPEHYNLKLILSRQDRRFDGTVVISGTVTEPCNSVRLHSKGLTVKNALINSAEASVSIDNEADEVTLSFDDEVSDQVTIELQFSGAITDAMHGLYPCYFEHDGVKKELLATQFESHHAREVFPCIDEPEAKATFDLTLYTEKDVSVLGNMPITEQKEDESWLITSFERTPRMSSYLLAFIVGEMHYKEAKTNNGTEVRVWATHAQASEKLDFALQSAVRTIEFFNDYFQVPYPLPKSDHVALPDFASGAMENWGLITYRETTLLVDPKTTAVSVKEYVATVVAHELSHQWFGNLVTMNWWDDLWLNESFATLMEYVAVDALYPEWNIWLSFASSEALAALRRDAIPGVQPVKTDVNHPSEIGTLFDGAIVYAKGARLLYMLYNYVGQEAFQQGLKAYFAKHAYGNTIGMDLWKSIGEASDKNIAEFMDQWLIQPGFPIVTVKQTDDELHLTQRRFSLAADQQTDKSIWPIPIASSLQSDTGELFEADEAILRIDTKEKVRINSGGIGHYTVRYESDDQRNSIITALKNNEIEPAERLLLLNDGAMQARAGIGSITEVLSLLRAYESETSEPVWDMISLIIADTKRLIEDDDETEALFKSYVRGIIDTEYKRLGWDEIKNEPNSDTKLRATILGLGVYSEDVEIIEEAKRRFNAAPTLEDLPAETRGIILSAVVRYDDKNSFDDLLKIHNETQNAELKQEIASSLTSTRESVRIKQLLTLMTDQEVVRLQDVDHWFVWLIRNRYGRSDSWQWMVDNWSWIADKFSDDKSYENFPRYAASALNTDEWLERYTTFFNPLSEQPALRRTISMGIADIASRAQWRNRDSALVRQFLEQLDLNVS